MFITGPKRYKIKRLEKVIGFADTIRTETYMDFINTFYCR